MIIKAQNELAPTCCTNNTTKTKTLKNYGDLLTVDDLSNFLGISKQTVYKEIKAGKFGTPFKFGRVYKIPKAYIQQRYLDRC